MDSYESEARIGHPSTILRLLLPEVSLVLFGGSCFGSAIPAPWAAVRF